MNLLYDPNLNTEIKILVLMYILCYALPEMLNEMPEIYQEDNKLQAAWLLKNIKYKK